jgi:hypothetical protein
LLEIGGESQWKNLKALARTRLHWSPTTVKKTLDQLIEKKQIVKEARLGSKGAEVWYRIKTPADLLKPIIIWRPTLQYEKPPGLDKRFSFIRETAQKLEGKKKKAFLREILHRVLFAVFLGHMGQFLIALRTAEVNKSEKAEALLSFNLSFDYLIRQVDELLFDLLLDFRKTSMEVIDQILREPYKPASVLPRSIEGFLSSESSALKWIDSYIENVE